MFVTRVSCRRQPLLTLLLNNKQLQSPSPSSFCCQPTEAPYKMLRFYLLDLQSRPFYTFCRHFHSCLRDEGVINHISLSHCCYKKQMMSTKAKDTIMNVFDRKAKRLQKDRSAVGCDGEDVTVYDYLKDEFAYRVSDRICDIKRKMSVAVDLGCGRGNLSKNIYGDMVERLIQCDLSHDAVKCADVSPEVPTFKVAMDEEFIPFRENSLDAVFSNLSLHWVNDLPGCLRQIKQALKNDGVLLGSMFGGETLYELRCSLQLAELEREGGFAPHVSPFTTVNDLGNLLTRAGFNMLTIDVDTVVIHYPTMFEVMFDLKGMGENNCAWRRKLLLHRDSMIAAAAIYKEMYGQDAEGVPATFEVINFIAWKPDLSQPKAAARGSGEVSLKDLGKFEKISKEKGKQKQSESEDVEALAAKMEDLEDELRHLSTKYKKPETDGDGTDNSGSKLR